MSQPWVDHVALKIIIISMRMNVFKTACLVAFVYMNQISLNCACGYMNGTCYIQGLLNQKWGQTKSLLGLDYWQTIYYKQRKYSLYSPKWQNH